MQFKGALRKMQTELADPIDYFLVFEQDFLHLNQVLDRTLRIDFIAYECLVCGQGRPIFRQGCCKGCFYESPATGDWIMRPELSKAHLDQEDRDLAYEKKVQLQPHILYLANSSNLKVGVTRKTQLPTRWIDQGAQEAIAIAEVPNRYLAGIAEVALKEHVADKTNWRKMLTNDASAAVDLPAWRAKLKPYMPAEITPFLVEDWPSTRLAFPVREYPTKVQSLNLRKTAGYQGVLKGIKGQYLIFKDGTVFNVRSHEGFLVGLSVS